ncbi:class II fructose-bisphosphate aldolase [bacterium]|nr:class II fructose-bisphosphate aldolase [bacterium]
MALESMKEMLCDAKEKKYAVGAFNILDYNSMKAVVCAAEETQSPIIVQTSVITVQLWGAETMMSWAKEICSESKIPVAIHLDHCKDIAVIKECIDAGWTSVMIDASSKPFDENLSITRQVAALAENRGVSVEAELGEIGGVEDDISVSDEDAHLANLDKAEKFCNEVSLDCFAPAVGTAHGVYKGEPKIDFNRIEEIAKRTNLPLALHGGTGLSDEVFLKCISLGCAKINISTLLKYAFIDSFIDYYNSNKTEYNPLNEIKAQFNKVKNTVTEKLRLFGSVGKI